MKMNSTHFLWLILLVMCSCTAPGVITTISPEAPEGQHANGREYIPLESDQIAVELGYDGIMDDKLIFDFVIHNGSRDTLFIQPGGFFYAVLDSANAESDFRESWFSLHPDTVSLLMRFSVLPGRPISI